MHIPDGSSGPPSRYTYAFGYKSHEAAEEALEEMFAFGEMSRAERPAIEAYTCRSTGKKKYCITQDA